MPTKKPKTERKGARPPPAKQPVAPKSEPSHKQRFEQLLDDVVLGVPPKR